MSSVWITCSLKKRYLLLSKYAYLFLPPLSPPTIPSINSFTVGIRSIAPAANEAERLQSLSTGSAIPSMAELERPVSSLSGGNPDEVQSEVDKASYKLVATAPSSKDLAGYLEQALCRENELLNTRRKITRRHCVLPQDGAHRAASRTVFRILSSMGSGR